MYEHAALATKIRWSNEGKKRLYRVYALVIHGSKTLFSHFFPRIIERLLPKLWDNVHLGTSRFKALLPLGSLAHYIPSHVYPVYVVRARRSFFGIRAMIHFFSSNEVTVQRHRSWRSSEWGPKIVPRFVLRKQTDLTVSFSSRPRWVWLFVFLIAYASSE